MQFDLRPYRVLTPAEIEALDQAARRYGEYLGLKPQIILPLPGGLPHPRCKREVAVVKRHMVSGDDSRFTVR